MITNSKSEFFSQLEYELERIGINYTDDIKLDFEEHFAECKDEGVSETEAANRLGDVKEIARNYLNLESTRINSMVARDIERKVSLTKPGREVPADLSLLKDKQNEIEHFIEYTPEHFSEEIYPQAQNSQKQSGFSYGAQPNADTGSKNVSGGGYSGSSAGSSTGTFSGSSMGTSAQSSAETSARTSSAGSAEASAAKPSVSEAFSNAGSAIADAAKAAGSAIADAIENSQVKKAVKNAGQNAASAVKQAGHNAASAVKNAAGNIPHPNDSFREHSNHNRKGTIPNSQNQNNGKKGSAFTDIKDVKPDVNGGKLTLAILLDVFLWSWLLPVIISAVISMILGGIGLFFETGIPAFFDPGGYNANNYEIVNLFFGLGTCSFGLILSLVGIILIKPVIKLVKFIIELHIKAIYNL